MGVPAMPSGYPHSLFFCKKGVQTIATIPNAMPPIKGESGIFLNPNFLAKIRVEPDTLQGQALRVLTKKIFLFPYGRAYFFCETLHLVIHKPFNP